MGETNQRRPDVRPGGKGEEVYNELSGEQGDEKFTKAFGVGKYEPGKIIPSEEPSPLVTEVRHYRLRLNSALEGIILLRNTSEFPYNFTLQEMYSHVSKFLEKYEAGEFDGKNIPYLYHFYSVRDTTKQMLDEHYNPKLLLPDVIKEIEEKLQNVSETMETPQPPQQL